MSELDIIEIIEGGTKLLVPSGSVYDKIPPKEPAFFNPKAKLNRDLSIIAYGAFLKDFKGPKIIFDSLAGLGARGIRAANEIPGLDRVVINDVNVKALDLAQRSSDINQLKCEISEDETCRFLSKQSRKEKRATIVDVDPFGSPARYLDCALRATIHGGMISMTATDLQVLNGLFDHACMRRYGGVPIKTEYSNEIAIRLMLGCLSSIADRMDITIQPLFIESDMHYYRAYVRILNKPNQKINRGFIIHCKTCGHRIVSNEKIDNCNVCKSDTAIAGYLWIDKIFDDQFLDLMIQYEPKIISNKKCQTILETARKEANLPASYFTIDDIAKKTSRSPPKLIKVINNLKESGYAASPTSLNPTGFRTDADISKIIDVFC